MTVIIDITGKRFGKLLVIRRSDKRNSSNDVLWECTCDCGNIKLATSGALRHGRTKACGCMMGNPTHKDWGKSIRNIWLGMMARCYKENSTNYHYYGAKGILVCKEWHFYEVFKKWAFENGYIQGLTIERKNNKKGYNPKNCKWATYKEQNNNRSTNRFVTIDGVRKTLVQWSEVSGISQYRIRRRLESGWNAKDAVYLPINKSKISKCYR